jgi:hypothetical protein
MLRCYCFSHCCFVFVVLILRCLTGTVACMPANANCVKYPCSPEVGPKINQRNGQHKFLRQYYYYCYLFIYIYLLKLQKGFLPGGSGTTIRHNTKITHITQNNTPHSNRNTAYHINSFKCHLHGIIPVAEIVYFPPMCNGLISIYICMQHTRKFVGANPGWRLLCSENTISMYCVPNFPYLVKEVDEILLKINFFWNMTHQVTLKVDAALL